METFALICIMDSRPILLMFQEAVLTTVYMRENREEYTMTLAMVKADLAGLLQRSQLKRNSGQIQSALIYILVCMSGTRSVFSTFDVYTN